MKSFAVISLLASVAFASTIPSTASDGCKAYMTKLDNDTTLEACTTQIVSATKAFAPGASNGDVTAALSQVCGTSSCGETELRTTLTSFYQACTAELTSNINKDVLALYDSLYTLSPLQTALCSKSDDGSSCATQLPGSPPSPSSLYTGSQDTLTPNFAALGSSNAAFLFLQPALDSSSLCKPCTKSVLTSYISWESNANYAPGLGNSLLLAGQTPLYQAVTQKCGATFLSGAVAAAGSLSDGLLTSGAASAHSGSSAGVIASLLGAVTVAVAAAL
ncbi:hypothetical protein BDW22DRAFT_647404 [Trametopsis cervina]|nr:hypothetical protein BDW22DRAFT_647404 [Trametopsis cervina]